MLGAADRIVTVEFDKKHKKPHLTVENSFNQQTTNFATVIHLEATK
jgi:hypothetical protein